MTSVIRGRRGSARSAVLAAQRPRAGLKCNRDSGQIRQWLNGTDESLCDEIAM